MARGYYVPTDKDKKLKMFTPNKTGRKVMHKVINNRVVL